MPNVRDMADPNSPNYGPDGRRKLSATSGQRLNQSHVRPGCPLLGLLYVAVLGAAARLLRGAR